ncbi:MAG TPA: peptidylprolyl isomerase [Bryobacteraceae bacterium]|nr:peptidylprolyl isomerase [Bryobacteraceae bacterium]
MFDLFRSRDKVVRYMLGGILVIVSLSMLVYLIPGAGMPSYGTPQTVLAEVAGEKVTASDIERALQDQTRGQQIPPDVIAVFVPQLIQRNISERAIAYQARHLGFQVTDADVARAIRSTPNIGSLPPDQYQATLAQMGYTVQEFENNMRERLYTLALYNVVMNGIVIPPKQVEDMYRKTNEKIKLTYIAFSPDKLKAGITPTPAELQAYYDGNKNMLKVPETRDASLLIADQDKIAATVQIPEEQLQGYYNSHKDDFRTPERVKVRHILLQTTGKSPDEVKKIRAQADDLLKQLKAGGDFAALAKKFSQDPGSAQNGGDLGWVTRGQMVKNFEAACFSVPPGQLSDIITTEYGFHILQVMEKQQAQLQPFDNVKAQIADSLKKQMVVDKLQSVADQAHSELVKAPMNGEQIAAKLGLDFVRANALQASGPLPVIGVNRDLSDAINSGKKGDVTAVVQVAPTKLAMATVTAVNPPHVPAMAEVEAQVKTQLVQQKSSQLANEKAQQALDMLKKNGGDFNAVAKSLGGEVKTSEPFTRNGAIEGVGNGAYFEKEFDKAVGTIIGPINTGSSVVVAKIVDKVEPDPTQLAKERDRLIEQLKAKQQQEREALFSDSIKTKLEQEGKIKYHQDAINQFIARYRHS